MIYNILRDYLNKINFLKIIIKKVYMNKNRNRLMFIYIT